MKEQIILLEEHDDVDSIREKLGWVRAARVLLLFPSGHHHAGQVARTQPEKFAAMEAVIQGRTEAPLAVFGIPSEEPPALKARIEIPGLLSLMAFGDANAHVAGIEDLREAGHPTPPFVLTFLSFHAMVGLGAIFILLTAFGVFLLLRRRLYQTRWYLKLLLWAIPLPLIACQLAPSISMS